MLLQTEHPRRRARAPARGGAQGARRDARRSARRDVPSVRRLVKVGARAGRRRAPPGRARGAALARRGRRGGGAGASRSWPRRRRAPRRSPSATRCSRSILAPGDDGPLAELFVLLGPTLAEALGPNLQACGVGRARQGRPAQRPRAPQRDRGVGGRVRHPRVRPLRRRQGPARRPGHPRRAAGARRGVRRQRAAVARDPRARRARAPRDGARDDGRRARATTSPSPRSSSPRAAWPRCRSSTRPTPCWPRSSACSARPSRARRARPSPDVCRAIVARGADARAWSKRALASHDRIAVVASGDPSVVLSDVLGTSTEKLPQAVEGQRARGGAPALRPVAPVPRAPALPRAGGRRMTDDKKPPEELEGVDWDEALSEWENKSFVPEVAKDVATDKPATLSGGPVSKPLYRPPSVAQPPRPSRRLPCPRRPLGQPAAEAAARSPAAAARPAARPEPRRPPRSTSRRRRATRPSSRPSRASCCAASCGPRRPPPSRSSRGGLGQLFAREEKHAPVASVEVSFDESQPQDAGRPRPPSDPPSEVFTSAKAVVPSRPDQAEAVPLRRPVAGRRLPSACPRKGACSIRSQDRDPRSAQSTRPAEEEVDDLLAQSTPPPALEEARLDEPPPASTTQVMPGTSEPPGRGPALLAPEARKYDPNEETMVGSDADMARARAAAAAKRSGSAPGEDEEEPTGLEARTRAAIEAPSRTWADEKPASAWLSDGAREALTARVGLARRGGAGPRGQGGARARAARVQRDRCDRGRPRARPGARRGGARSRAVARAGAPAGSRPHAVASRSGGLPRGPRRRGQADPRRPRPHPLHAARVGGPARGGRRGRRAQAPRPGGADRHGGRARSHRPRRPRPGPRRDCERRPAPGRARRSWRPSSEAISLALRLRGVERKEVASGDLSANELLLRARQALEQGGRRRGGAARRAARERPRARGWSRVARGRAGRHARGAARRVGRDGCGTSSTAATTRRAGRWSPAGSSSATATSSPSRSPAEGRSTSAERVALATLARLPALADRSPPRRDGGDAGHGAPGRDGRRAVHARLGRRTGRPGAGPRDAHGGLAGVARARDHRAAARLRPRRRAEVEARPREARREVRGRPRSGARDGGRGRGGRSTSASRSRRGGRRAGRTRRRRSGRWPRPSWPSGRAAACAPSRPTRRRAPRIRPTRRRCGPSRRSSRSTSWGR